MPGSDPAPNWLYALRTMVYAASILLAILGARLLSEETRTRHNQAVANFVQELRRFQRPRLAFFTAASAAVNRAFGLIYGEEVRLFRTSLLLSLVYMGIALWLHAPWIESASRFVGEKQALERSVDPDDRYAPEEIERAMKTRIVGRRPETMEAIPIFWEPRDVEIREAFANRDTEWVKALWASPHSQEIAFLTIRDGNRWDPGPKVMAIASLVVFNALFDLCLLLVVRGILERMSLARGAGPYVGGVVALALVVAGAYAVFLVPVLFLTSGYLSAFTILLVGTPVALLVAIAGVVGFATLIFVRDPDGRGERLFGSFAATALGGWALWAIAQRLGAMGLPAIPVHPLPYALASCAVVPGVLALTALSVAAAGRLAGSSAAVPLDWYLAASDLAGGRWIAVGIAAFTIVLIEFAMALMHSDFWSWMAGLL